MSELPIDECAPEEAQLEEKALAAFQEGFLLLETPSPAARIEAEVKRSLTSGTDFDPLPRQVGRRVMWMAAPGIAAFLIVSGILAFRPVPRMPLMRWLASQNQWFQTPERPANIDQICRAPSFLPSLNPVEDGFQTHLRSLDAPTWFRKPLVQQKAKSAPTMMTSKSKGKVKPK